MDLDPLVARERAFSYLEYYVQLLHEGKKISISEKGNEVDSFLDISELSKYNFRFAENNFDLNGIAIYMIINKPIDFMGKTDEIENRYLIFSVQNITEEIQDKMKHGLIREYGYYQSARIDTSDVESSVTIHSNRTQKITFQDEILVYTTLKIPFNFFVLDDKINRKILMLKKVNQRL